MTKSSFAFPLAALGAVTLLAACGGGGASPGLATAAQPVPAPLAAQSAQPAQPAQPQVTTAVAKIVVTIGGSPALGTPGTYPLTIVEEDGTGAPIAGSYAKMVTLTDSDVTGATKLSATRVASSTTVVTLAYTGLGGSSLGGFQGATITAASGGLTSDVAFLPGGAGCTTFEDIGGYYPCDLQSAYSLPSSVAGAGQTVAVVDAFDDPNAEADLGVYRSQFGLPPCTTANHCFRKVNESGREGDPPLVDSTGWSTEESLDLDMVSAICPNCHLILVEADSDTLNDLARAVDAAAALHATQISNSYGLREEQNEPALDVHYHHPDSTIVASAGDSDYDDTPDFPASSPYVTAVGGTNLTTAANGRGWNEIVWNNADLQGTVSGCSSFEPKPAWQVDTGCPNKRMVADVAAVADPFSGVAVYDTFITSNIGGWQVFGGTSVSAPLIAGVYALAGMKARALDYGSYSYSHASSLNDVTNGGDGGCGTYVQYFCTAEVGYDGPTGNGTPNGLGAFGGSALETSANRAALRRPVWRHVIEPSRGATVTRGCGTPKAGYFACDALLVR